MRLPSYFGVCFSLLGRRGSVFAMLTNRSRLLDLPPLRDTRNTSKPLYSNTAIHSDDITSLSFAPASLHSRAFPIVPSSPGSDTPTPKQPQSSAVLLSGSTDGLLALSNALEADEDESALGIGNVDVSVAKAGWVGEDWDVWARDDMDGVSRWDATDVRSGASILP